MYFRDRTEPRTWESLGFDLPEITEPSDVPGYLGYVPSVPVTPEEYARALRHGIYVRESAGPPAQHRVPVPGQPDWDECYRGYNAMVAYLNSVVERFPHLAELADIGDSYDKLHPRPGFPPHDIWRIRLTNRELSGPKPRFHLVAAHHAREIATPELALQWIEELVTRYGVDADITWLLDHREIYVVPVQNPDGWWQAQNDYIYWRKNDNPRGCDHPNNGVDPNRNYPICWSCPGGNANPCDEMYHGTSAGSEPETQAMIAEYEAVRPDFVISLHTYGPLVLYPWGNTSYGTPPDKAGLDALAWNMGRMTGTPRERVGQPYDVLYEVSGTTDDWTYANLWVPSFTVELGGWGFFPPPASPRPATCAGSALR
jgi:hypothetical protein